MTRLETDANRSGQRETESRVEAAWNVKIGSMGPYTAFDCFMYREKKLVALCEIKNRLNRQSDSFSTAFLNLDKWFALVNAEIGLGVPAFYIT